ncbi:hypothetical protein NCCP2716_06830 [Sporosarcina sp. NCCP-2716]|uniref:DUF1641 domain-containing protein n=1 Tax=Sporosarcina sp. NCCP-2716 TaxID=2943679 RepID=UPI00203B9908|nr:DUF1641 domain-containing protein [Sporosarcina sp. NCCP-2716]GKV68185.1 hypothetical protein NCCP2716_06830 [Sporosarcina sp. NCCP-2716]
MTTPLNPEEAANTAAEGTQLPSEQKQDILDQLLKPEVQESLTTLVEKLPQLTELVDLMTKSYDIAKAVATDDVLKNDTAEFMKEIAAPVKDSAKNMAATIIEAKDLAAKSSETIGLFGLMKMIKDPEAQRIFRFLNAYLEIAGQRSRNN